MFTLLFLVAWLEDIKTLIANKTEQLVEAYKEEEEPDRGALVAEMWVMLRAAMYMGWLGQVGYIMQQAREAGVTVEYVPSMPGVSEKLVANILREELRMDRNIITAPTEYVADRVAYRFSTVVNEMCRNITREIDGSDKDWVERSQAYAKEHGQPVSRMISDFTVGKSEAARFVAENKEWREVADSFIDDFLDSFIDDDEIIETVKIERETRDEKNDSERNEFLETARARTVEVDREEALRESEEEKEVMRLLRMFDKKIPRDAKGTFALGWARVPTGAYTCSFCIMLASRGAVYSKDTVIAPKEHKGAIGGYGQHAYHWGCDCIGVPVYTKGFAMGASNVGDMSHVDGETIVVGAAKLWEAFLDWKDRTTLSAANFEVFLGTPEGKRAREKYLPDIATTSGEYRRVQRRHTK